MEIQDVRLYKAEIGVRFESKIVYIIAPSRAVAEAQLREIGRVRAIFRVASVVEKSLLAGGFPETMLV